MDEGERSMMMAAERRIAAIRRKSEAVGVKKGRTQERRVFKARDKKIAQYLLSIGVSSANIATAFAIK